MTSPPRPTGISVLAIIFALWAFQGIGRFIPDNAALFDGVVGAFRTEPLRQVIGVMFLVASVFSAYGFWEMKRWALWPYSLAAALFVAGGVAKDIQLKVQGQSETGWVGIILPWVIIAGVWLLIGFYVNRALADEKPNQSVDRTDGRRRALSES